MTTMSPLRAATVSRFLGKNTRQERVVYRTTRIRGWGTWNTGFEAKGLQDGTVKVEFTTGSNSGGSPAYRNKLREEAMDEMEKALAARYTVTRKRDQWAPNAFGAEYLIVTAK